jgi:hypothetical protein
MPSASKLAGAEERARADEINIIDIAEPEVVEVALPLRDEISNYFTYMTGLVATPDQLEMLVSIIEYDRIEASAGRQSGKTLTVAVAIMYLTYKYHVPLRLFLLSPQENQVYAYMRRFFRGQHREELTENLVGSRSVQNIVPLGGFALERGSSVSVSKTIESSIRGEPADIVLIDEAYLVSRENILTAMGCLSGATSKLILISTPGPKFNKKLKENSLFMEWLDDPEFKIFHWSSLELPWHNKRLIDTKKKTLNPAEWASEVLGRAPTEDEIADSGNVIGEVIFTEIPSQRRLRQLARQALQEKQC